MVREEPGKEVEEYRKELKSKFFLSEPQLDLACQGFKDGYLAGLKVKTQWHDLRENPNDLPKEDNEYACRVPYYDSERTFNAFLNYNSERKVFWLDDLESTFTVIAWCEFPKFEE